MSLFENCSYSSGAAVGAGVLGTGVFTDVFTDVFTGVFTDILTDVFPDVVITEICARGRRKRFYGVVFGFPRWF